MIKANSFASLSLLALVACGGSDKAPAPAAPQAQAPPSSAPDPGFAPLSSRVQAPSSGTDQLSHVVDAPGVRFELPASWRPERPSSSMRLAQAAIPGSMGDGQLTVFYFGPGGGGPVEDNLQRWLGQIDLDPNQTPKRESFATAGFRVTMVDAIGTLLPSTMGSGPTSPQPGSRLLGAVVEGDQGPWFFKATGPAATLGEQREAFLTLLKSGRPNS